MVSRFVQDIAPFFRHRPLLYVDVGAYTGGVFFKLLQSNLVIHEAHLIEPNPISFKKLKDGIKKQENLKKIHCYNVALGGTDGEVGLQLNDTMSRIVETTADQELATRPQTHTVPVHRLDDLVKSFGRRHISLLKIDVEGFEMQVLEGAKTLLDEQAIDVIYIEAGFDPDSKDFIYYRTLEDFLKKYNYQIFKFFEQVNEWPEDSPALRRMNMAFMSKTFATNHPYRLSRELAALERRVADLTNELETARLGRAKAEEAARSAETGRLRAHAVAEERVKAAEAARELALAERNMAMESVKTTNEKMALVEAERARAEIRAEEAGKATLEAKAKAQSLASEAAMRVQSHLSYRLGAEIVAAERSPLQVLQLPYALVKAYREFKRDRQLGQETRPSTTRKASKTEERSKEDQLYAKVLENRLWEGFSTQALRELAQLKTAKDRHERAYAAWALARWYATRGDYAQAHDELGVMRKARPGPSMRRRLLEAECLTRLGRVEEARTKIADGLGRRGHEPNLCLAMANTFLPIDGGPDPDADRERLRWINQIYDEAGLQPLSLRDPERPLAFDNLTAAAPAVVDLTQEPLVSVIMPVYGAAATLPDALRSLLVQSWRNLEIIVVDDCSPDDTVAVAEGFAAQDPRVKVVRQPTNRGSYAARNAGLATATGEFVTTHDADDWSHPQKIELQVRFAAERPDTVANFSAWVRCTPELRFGWLLRPWDSMIAKNITSIFMRREHFEDLGGWDVVRVSADTELLRRVEELHGKKAVRNMKDRLPLAFGRRDAGSLTQQKLTHVATMMHGPRQEYHEASTFWRQTINDQDKLRFSAETFTNRRPFPAPVSIATTTNRNDDVDILFISDFRMLGGAFVSTFNYIQAAIADGRSVAVFDWQRYDLVGRKRRREINPAIRQLAQEGRLRIIAAGETIRATTVIVGYPVILNHQIDLCPEITFENFVVVVNQMASRMFDGSDPQYDPLLLRANLREWFDAEPVWVPISGLVKRLMEQDARYPKPHDDVWTPLLATRDWCRRPISWRGRERQHPVLGRHARDHYTKWPNNAADLRGAYCVDRDCTVELMGGAKRALEKLEQKPENWVVHGFNAMPTLDFLERLDFFLHYPHEGYIEEFGRAVLEALAVGVPVVLPPVFEQTFADAAVYAEPDRVWSVVDALWADENAYLKQAQAGRAFVLAKSDWSEFAKRLARLPASRPTAAVA